MKIQDIRPAAGSVKKRKRVGRGNGSGHGLTSGRGSKGANCRSGASRNAKFEGGQMPIHMRLPKLPGFRNINRMEYVPINLDRLDAFDDGAVVDTDMMFTAGMVKKDCRVKILGNGEIKKNLTVRAHAFSKSAQEKIIAAGGKIEVI